MTRTRSLGSALLVALTAAPLYGVGCADDPREFSEGGAGTSSQSGSTSAEGGEDAQGGSNSGGATSSGGGGSGATAGTTASDAGAGAGPIAAGGAGGSGDDDWSCVEAALEDTASGTTAGAEDDFAASCGRGSSPDVAYRFVAPASGYYSFDTLGSAFDTVVSIYSGGCGGTELACNQDSGGLPQSEAVAQLTKDQEVLVVVDGSVGDQGQYSLNVTPVTCPALDLTGQPFPASLSTVGQQDNLKPSCGGTADPSSPERTLRWVPETDGLYRFSATSTSFSPTLSVFEGAKCGGKLLQCSYNVLGGHPAEVTRRLEAGQPVTLIVDATDGKSGAFTLNMEKLSDTCPVLPLLSADKPSVMLTDANSTKILSSSCTWAGNQYGGTDEHFEEHIYPIKIAATGFTECTYTFENMNNAWVAYLLRGNDCSGEEIRCLNTGSEASFSFRTENAGDYLLVLENQYPFPGALGYDIVRNCY
jgi:hypothetical protein